MDKRGAVRIVSVELKELARKHGIDLTKVPHAWTTPPGHDFDPESGAQPRAYHAVTTLQQTAFRGRNDDGSETTASWKAAQSTNWTEPVDNIFRLRFQVGESGGAASSTTSWQLQCQLNNSGSWSNVGNATAIARIRLSPNVADGASTTNQLTGGFGGAFSVGSIDEVDGLASSQAIGAFGETELEWVLQLGSESVAPGDTVQFRVVQGGGTVLDAYAVTPSITAAAAQIAVDQVAFRFRNDDGSEVAATWREPQNGNDIQLATDTTYRVRFELQNNRGIPHGNAFKLQYRKNNGVWTDVTTTSTNVRAVTSANVTHWQATTDQLTAGGGFFTVGRVSHTGEFQAISIGNGNHIEHEAVVQFRSADLRLDDSIELRMLDVNAGATLVYTATPRAGFGWAWADARMPQGRGGRVGPFRINGWYYAIMGSVAGAPRENFCAIFRTQTPETPSSWKCVSVLRSRQSAPVLFVHADAHVDGSDIYVTTSHRANSSPAANQAHLQQVFHTSTLALDSGFSGSDWNNTTSAHPWETYAAKRDASAERIVVKPDSSTSDNINFIEVDTTDFLSYRNARGSFDVAAGPPGGGFGSDPSLLRLVLGTSGRMHVFYAAEPTSNTYDIRHGVITSGNTLLATQLITTVVLGSSLRELQDFSEAVFKSATSEVGFLYKTIDTNANLKMARAVSADTPTWTTETVTTEIGVSEDTSRLLGVWENNWVAIWSSSFTGGPGLRIAVRTAQGWQTPEWAVMGSHDNFSGNIYGGRYYIFSQDSGRTASPSFLEVELAPVLQTKPGAQGGSGPWLIGSYLYAVMLHHRREEGPSGYAMYRCPTSSDPTVETNWKMVGTNKVTLAANDGTTFHAVTYDSGAGRVYVVGRYSNGAISRLGWNYFDLTTLDWVNYPPIQTDVDMTAYAAVVANDGDLVVVGVSSGSVYYVRRTAGVWGTRTLLATGDNPSLIKDGAGRIHVFYGRSGDLYRRHINPNWSLGTEQLVRAGHDTVTVVRGAYDASTDSLVMPHRKPVSTLDQLHLAKATAADQPSWSFQQVDESATQESERYGGYAYVAATQGQVHVFWSKFTRDLYYDKDTGGGFGTDVLQHANSDPQGQNPPRPLPTLGVYTRNSQPYVGYWVGEVITTYPNSVPPQYVEIAVTTAPQNFQRSRTDALGMLDQALRLPAYIRAVVESLPLSDSSAALKVSVKTLQEPLGILDSPSPFAALKRDRTDALGLLDAAAQAAAVTRSRTDLLGLQDPISQVATRFLSQALFDALGVVDLTLLSAGLYRSRDDGLGLVDAPSPFAATKRDRNDGLGMLDAASFFFDLARASSDALGLDDSVSKGYSFFQAEALGVLDLRLSLLTRPTTDSVGLTDLHLRRTGATFGDVLALLDEASYPQSQSYLRGVVEALGLTDAPLSALGHIRLDALGVSDSQTRVFSGIRAEADLVALLDAVAGSQESLRVQTELLGALDTLARGSVRLQTDSQGFTDALDRFYAARRSQTNQAALEDSRSLASGKKADDSVGLSDSTSRLTEVVRGLADGLGLLDANRVVMGRVLSDPASVVDLHTATVGYVRALMGSLGLQDTVSESAEGFIGQVVQEALGLTEQLVAAAMYAQATSDTSSLADALQSGRQALIAEALTILDSRVGFLTKSQLSELGLTDSSARAFSANRSQVELVSLSDSRAQGIAKLTTDFLIDTDEIAATSSFSREETEAVNLSDALLREFASVVSDSESLQDSAVRALAVPRELAEAVGLTDLTSSAASMVRGLLDEEGLSDEALRGRALQVGDVLGLQDSSNYARIVVQAVTDVAGITDSHERLAALQRQLFDAAGVEDLLDVTPVLIRGLGDELGLTDDQTQLLVASSKDFVAVLRVDWRLKMVVDETSATGVDSPMVAVSEVVRMERS